MKIGLGTDDTDTCLVEFFSVRSLSPILRAIREIVVPQSPNFLPISKSESPAFHIFVNLSLSISSIVSRFGSFNLLTYT